MSPRRQSKYGTVADHAVLAAQFDVERNGRMPAQVNAGTSEKLWWACPVADDHRWQAIGASRVGGRGCPACAGQQVSVTNNLARFPELAAQFDVEANGGRTPDQVVAGTSKKLWWACPVADDHRWQATGASRVGLGSGCPACAGLRVSVTNSLANHPELAAQFDVGANGGLTPAQVVARTGVKLWWACPVADDHRWAATGGSRVGQGAGCPACAGLQVSVTNSLANHPELAAQLDVAANGGRTPNQIVATTDKKLWWACPVADDHRWQARCNSRLKGHGCPACAGQQASVTNNLLNHPELAAQFDVERNGRTPDQIVAGTHEKLWWACPVAPDHRWQEAGNARMRGYGCPFCAGKRVSRSNSLANHPELAAQFDVERNGRTADQVVAGTNQRLWWACPVAEDHRWQEAGDLRLRGYGCPFCAGKRVSRSNSLANHPELAAQFDVERNGRTADQVVAGTHEKLWWVCPIAPDHRWRTPGKARTGRGDGCPACAGQQVSVTNSLAGFPELAAQFDVERNGRTPDQVVAGTNERLWWVCPAADDHRWRTTGHTRVYRGDGCPACALIKVSMREVRLAAELAAVLPGLDVDDHRIVLPGRRTQHADIVDRRRRLIVEYDGRYWHAGEQKERRDRDKTAWLTEAGYTVIRVREAPLVSITAADVQVSPRDPIHAVTAAVLDRIAQVRPDALDAAAAVAYRADGRERASAAAEARLKELPVRTRRRRTSLQETVLVTDPLSPGP